MQLPRTAAAVLPLMLGMGAAHAIEIDLGNPDLAVRWDNSIRYTYAARVTSPDAAIVGNPNTDDGDRNFKKGSTVSNRLDLLSELDVVYQKSFGVRVSGAGWYDNAYEHLDNTSLSTSNTVVDGQQALGLSGNTKHYYLGPSAELLDAFAFVKFDVADMPLNIKVGRHTMYWGEAMLDPIDGLSYGQGPLDIRKQAAMPGTQVKELFVPRSALSGQLQVNPEVSLAAQYFLAWNPIRLPEAGTFLSAADFVQGGQALLLGPGVLLPRGPDGTPNRTGDWGVSARLQPEWMDGTIGLYVRKTADIQPELNITPPLGQYNLVYPSGIHIYGLSLAHPVGSMSLGAEVNFRTNMPLVSEGVGTVGDTWHMVANLLGTIAKTPVFDSAGWLFEMQASGWTKVTAGQDLFKGRSGYVGSDRVSKAYLGFGVSFTPTWFQALPGVDISVPLFVSSGVAGNSAVSGGGYKNTGNYSLGVGADIYQKYTVNLAFSDSFSTRTLDANGVVNASNSPIPATVTDRGFVSLTLKTQF